MQTRMRSTYGLVLVFVLISHKSGAANAGWTNKMHISAARFGLTACTVGGKIYAIGGTTATWPWAVYSTQATTLQFYRARLP